MNKHNKIRLIDFITPNIPAYTASVLLAVLAVAFGMVPYLAVHRLLIRLLQGPTAKEVFGYAAVIITAFTVQLTLHSFSTTISHKTAFSILEKIRLSVTEKMMKMPLRLYAQKRFRVLSCHAHRQY